MQFAINACYHQYMIIKGETVKKSLIILTLLGLTNYLHGLTKEEGLLLAAIYARNVPEVQKLLSEGVNPDFDFGGSGSKLLHIVAHDLTDLPLLRLLLNAGAKPDFKSLVFAITGKNLKGFQLLLEAGAEPDERISRMAEQSPDPIFRKRIMNLLESRIETGQSKPKS